MTEMQNQPPKTPFEQPVAPSGRAQLRSAQTLVTVATIAGPVSLIIGGVVLSTAGLVCAILAVAKVRRAMMGDLEQGLAIYASRLRRSAVLSLIICTLALVLNGIALATMLPAMMQAIQTGDLSALYEAYDLPQGSMDVGSGSSGSSSAWG